MKYFVRGKNKTIILTDNDFIDVGGEGKTYRYGNSVCKIYLDPDKMIPDDKITELSVLTKPNIIKPEEILVDANGKSVGFTMKYASGNPLPELFTNGFRNDNNITNPTINDIVKTIIDTISFIHDKKCLIVDGNELSYIVDLAINKLKTVYFIDVDSYQTPSFKPTAIHPSTKDIHSNTYSELTDWFGAAIIICWLYVGVHPYRGKHPKYKKKGLEGLEERMINNISIFNKSVTLSKKSRGVDSIPNNYKGWFIDLFENGNRCPPPGLPGRVILTPVYTKIIKGTDNFDIILLRELSGEIISYRKIFGTDIVITKEDQNKDTLYKYYINNKNVLTNKQNMEVVLSNISMTPVYVQQSDNRIDFKLNGRDDKICGTTFGYSKFVSGNTVYVKNGEELNSIELTETKFKETSKIIASNENDWNVMPNSSSIFDGFLYQKALGRSFVYIPIPSKNQCMIIKVPELEEYRIVSGRYDKYVCMIVGRKKSVYHKVIIRFSSDFTTYDCRIIEDVDLDSINIAVLSNGICASMESTNTLELFRNIPNDSGLKSVTDPEINSSMKLWSDGTRLLFSDNNKLYVIKMRK